MQIHAFGAVTPTSGTPVALFSDAAKEIIKRGVYNLTVQGIPGKTAVIYLLTNDQPPAADFSNVFRVLSASEAVDISAPGVNATDITALWVDVDAAAVEGAGVFSSAIEK